MECHRQIARRRPSGFTLLEIMVVMTIIGLLMALVGPRLFSTIGQAEQRAARAQIKLFETALETFRMEIGRYPTRQEGLAALVEKPSGAERWSGPYLREVAVPTDPWGRTYEYRAPADHGLPYRIVSYGADGVPGGEGENGDIIG